MKSILNMLGIACPEGGRHDWERIAIYLNTDTRILIEDKVCLKCRTKRDEGALRAVNAQKIMDEQGDVRKRERHIRAVEVWTRVESASGDQE